MIRAQLVEELQQAVGGGTPVEVVDPVTQQVYYLISADQFQKMRAAISSDFDPRDAYPLIEQVMADDDANDPWLASYQ